MCCMVLTLLPTTVLAADGPMDTVPTGYDVSINLYKRTSDVNIGDSKTYYIYSSVPDKLRDQWSWKKKIQIKGSSAAPHIFLDGLNIDVSPSAKTPAIEVNGKAKAYLYFIDRDSTLQGASGRAAIQKNRSENQVHILVQTGTTVTCTGGETAAGIGGGQFVPAHDITITGGYITARGVYGAAIGGGRWMHGKNITVTDANLKLSAGRWSNGSDAAAMGYGDLVYDLEDLAKDPSITTNDAIKIGSKEKQIVWPKAQAYGLTANGKCALFSINDFLIPNERGLIDVSLLTLPFVQNYGWTIYELEMIMMYTSCKGNHTYSWKDMNGYHVWARKRCFGRDPTKQGARGERKAYPGGWEGQEKKCTVCGFVMTKDTTPPVIEGVVDGWDYTDDDTDDGQIGTLSFTVSDPAGEKETSSGIKSVTVNGVEQTGPTYQLAAPDGGNNDEGLVYEIVATDNAGNSTTAKVRVYRRHRVLFVEDRNDWSKKFAEVGVPHGFDLDFPFSLPKEAYFIDLDDESIKIYYDEENKTYNFGVINSNRTFLLVIPKTELTELTIQFMREKFFGYHADDSDKFCYANPVSKTETGYLMSIWVPSDETSYYFGTTARYTLEQLKALQY